MKKKKTQEQIWQQHQARKDKERNDRYAILTQLAKYTHKTWRWL